METPAMRQLLILLILGQTNTWIGQRVITHYGTSLMVGRQVVDDEKTILGDRRGAAAFEE
jgi:hypothetical protein